jgi:choline kinase
MTSCTRAVLLAAGRGKRLLPHTLDRPKCMVPVNGRPIVDGLIDALAGLGIEELVVVIGYRGDALRDHLGGRRAGIEIRYVENPVFDTTNNIYSLHLARPAIRAPFLLLESDVVAEPAVLGAIVEPDRIAVARYDRAMTGTGVRIDADGRIDEVILAAHHGERAGVYKTVNFYSFSAAVWSVYAQRLDRWIGRGEVNAYYEAVLAELINAGEVTMTAADVTHRLWWEIDDDTDLRRAEAMLRAARREIAA